MDKETILASLESELKRGTIILCVLSQLNNPMYGYNLINTLASKGITIEANTLYPLLRRLESQGLLESRWETGGSKPRKYYTITVFGSEIYYDFKRIWKNTIQKMNHLWEGEENEAK